MLTFCILKNNFDRNLVVAKTGFSIFAFFLGPIWGVFRKLWLYSFIGIFYLVISSYVLKWFNASYLFIVFSLVSNLFWGKFARDLYIQNLISNNFTPIKHINAESKETAFIKFLSEENNE